jgi:hypothetical protein
MESVDQPHSLGSNRDGASHRRSGAAESLILGGALLATRIAIATGVAMLTHGREFTDDTHLHLEYAAHPLSRLLGTITNPPYPPLQGLLQAASVGVLRPFLGDFLALRVAFSFFEAAALSITLTTLRMLSVSASVRRGLALVMILAPVGWMSGSIMCQEEAIGMTFVAGAILAEVSGRRHITLLLLSLGVVTGKVFFIFPLSVLFLLSPRLRLARRLYWAATPLAVTYGSMAAVLLLTGRAPERFRLSVFGVNVWTFLRLQFPLSQQFCEGGAVVAIGLAMGVIFFLARKASDSPARGVATLSVALCASFLLFLHTNPEYYLMVLPAAVVLFPRIGPAALLAMLLSVPWSTNFVDGVANAVRLPAANGKAVFVQLYFKCVGIEPARLSPVAQCVSVLALSVVVVMLARCLRPQGGGGRMEGADKDREEGGGGSPYGRQG